MNHISYHLRDIHFNRKSGLLTFRRNGIEKTLCFQEGNLIFAKTNQAEERLGAILHKLGKISDDVYSRIDEYIKPGQKIGETLVKSGVISKKDLYDGWISQMREIALSIFSYFDGEFSFEEMETFLDQEFESRISIPFLIEDGIRRMKFHSSLLSFLEGKVPVKKGKVYFYLLTEVEKEILALIDGKTPADNILSTTGYSPELFWKSLYLFYCLDLVDLLPGREEISFEEKPAVAESGKGVSNDRLAGLEKVWSRLSIMDYYQLLNVSPTASEEEIKRSYFDLARKYHPDSFGPELTPELKVKVEQVFDHITKAYQTLTDRKKREEYEAAAMREPEEEEQDLSRKADIKFRKAKTLYQQRRYEDALILLEEAVRIIRDKGSYFLLLALVESKLPNMRKKAEQDFLKAIELEPWNPECYVGLGLFYKKEGLKARSMKQFKKALELDPEHTLALKEMEEAGMIKKKKGIMDILTTDLFSRKK
ncbi:MAG: DnaJ domain-containing protein [Candidatus Aminicenantales bacterium]